MQRFLVEGYPTWLGRVVTRSHQKIFGCSKCLLLRKQSSEKQTFRGQVRKYFTSPNNGARFNPLEIQMLSEGLHQQVFRGKRERYDDEVVQKCREHLSKHGLWGKSSSVLDDVQLDLPALMGSNIDEHFREIAKQQSKPYFDRAQWLAHSSLPPMPEEWLFSTGWTKYECSEDGVVVTSVDFPDEEAMIFDIEICVKEGPYPTLAVAVSPNAW